MFVQGSRSAFSRFPRAALWTVRPFSSKRARSCYNPGVAVVAAGAASLGAALAFCNPKGILRDRASKTTKEWTYYSGLPLKDDGIRVFSGTANPALSDEVAGYLGVELGRVELGRFNDGEVSIRILETVRGKDVVIIQSCSPPVDDNLIELLLLVAAMRRSSARTITVALPYYGYSRSDCKMRSRVPISASDVAIMLQTVGVDRLLVVDLHASQIQGFFSNKVPTDVLPATKVGALFFSEQGLKNPVVVAPRSDSVARARDFRATLVSKGLTETRLAMVMRQKKKSGTAGDLSDPTARADAGSADGDFEVVGTAGVFEDADVVIVDDIIDGAATLCDAAQSIKRLGARNVYGFASHGLFSGDALKRIEESALTKVVTTNTVALPRELGDQCSKVERVSLAPLIAEAVRRICDDESLSAIFATTNVPEER